MRAVIQRVSSASVTIDGEKISTIDQGFLILLGVEKNDKLEDLNYMVKKTIGLRIFKDGKNKMNHSIQDVSGEMLVVSQFTLCANTQKGRRPSYLNAASPEMAKNMYDEYCKKLRDENISVKTGRFGAMMDVGLINDGPVTIMLESRNR